MLKTSRLGVEKSNAPSWVGWGDFLSLDFCAETRLRTRVRRGLRGLAPRCGSAQMKTSSFIFFSAPLRLCVKKPFQNLDFF